MSNHHHQITLKISINRVPGESTSSEAAPLERTIHVGREQFASVKTKAALTELLSKALNGELTSNDQFVSYTRKSKKHKDFIPLDSSDDFRSLARSLKVKNHVRLLVTDSSPSGTYSSNSKSKVRSTSALDFASLGDALIEAAFEHFKELFNDLASANNQVLRELSEHKPTTTEPTSAAEVNTNVTSDSMEADVSDVPKEEEEDVPVHSNICCDICHPNDFVPIRGIRYCCLVCPNFDLCASCEAKQQKEKKDYGTHLHSHAMAKITDPNPSFFKQAPHYQPFHCPEPLRTGPTCDVRGNDIILDIPLDGSKETKETLEKVFGNEACYGDFAADLEHYVKDSERYNQLVELVDAKAYEIDPEDDELKFAILKSIIEAAKTEIVETSDPVEASLTPTTSSDREVTPIFTTGEGQIVIRPKKSSQNSRIISLMLTNNSNDVIKGGTLRFEFFNSDKHDTVMVKNASDVKPGQQRFYNLGKLNDDLDKIEGTRLRITTSNAVLEGDYQNYTDSVLTIAAIKLPNHVVEEERKSESNTPEIIHDERALADSSEDLDKVKEGSVVVVGKDEDESSVLGEGDEVLVSLVPKSGTLSQIIITNKSGKTIDCSNLKFEIVNCFNKSVVAIIIRKNHGISPGKVGKFNISLSNAHTKYPFKLLMRNDHTTAFCDMDSDCLSGRFTFETSTPTSPQDTEGHTSNTESIDEKMEMSSPDEQESSGSFHSVVLPEIPRESLHIDAGSEYLDAIQSIETPEGNDSDEDYDVISVADDEEDASDFEILSSVSSNGQ
ncbi:uncharacterized protein SPAPADRAFT_51386 [Spathaspora passalidarum NRRL Y-27907]|uniref:ZZ-type domain-containing protein n=1 Tax=Spathaspora passalidarum (strain NRRL Y-27907 / 11-Y1) TaxID=619300 RepID=G3ARV1_SPAPN|nr:uncharacterized protein SPAPADRAFT_51386 [Spathaspora passalidarum NRRL Y-27907]EGW31368.1 hypothetical protein SPAPADRAFT_51386 [Spathaspora passalidarum NRRL Y-27907]